jgi:hypothetical protein
LYQFWYSSGVRAPDWHKCAATASTYARISLIPELISGAEPSLAHDHELCPVDPGGPPYSQAKHLSLISQEVMRKKQIVVALFIEHLVILWLMQMPARSVSSCNAYEALSY